MGSIESGRRAAGETDRPSGVHPPERHAHPVPETTGARQGIIESWNPPQLLLQLILRPHEVFEAAVESAKNGFDIVNSAQEIVPKLGHAHSPDNDEALRWEVPPSDHARIVPWWGTEGFKGFGGPRAVTRAELSRKNLPGGNFRPAPAMDIRTAPSEARAPTPAPWIVLPDRHLILRRISVFVGIFWSSGEAAENRAYFKCFCSVYMSYMRKKYI